MHPEYDGPTYRIYRTGDYGELVKVGASSQWGKAALRAVVGKPVAGATYSFVDIRNGDVVASYRVQVTVTLEPI